MGSFTNVIIYKNLLPKKYQQYANKWWQTYDIVEPEFETLKITEDKNLFYIVNEYGCENNEKSLMEGNFKVIKTNCIKLEFDGNMKFGFYNNKTKKCIELIAKFVKGKLINIKLDN